MNDFDFEFQSIRQRYKGPEERDLHLKIYEYGNDVLEVNLINKHFSRLRRSLQKQVVWMFIVMIITLLVKISLNFYSSIINFLLLFWLIIKVWSISSLVKNEKFIFCYDFGLQIQTTTFLTKSNYFMAASSIHDIVINEVLENFDFHYLLIVRTKGVLFRKKPIIPIYKHLKPCGDCLHIIYKHLNKTMRKTCHE
ncbi:phosphatidylinositol glycan anchor biosynthesis class H [Glossina fuscipes fuscipes]